MDAPTLLTTDEAFALGPFTTVDVDVVAVERDFVLDDDDDVSIFRLFTGAKPSRAALVLVLDDGEEVVADVDVDVFAGRFFGFAPGLAVGFEDAFVVVVLVVEESPCFFNELWSFFQLLERFFRSIPTR